MEDGCWVADTHMSGMMLQQTDSCANAEPSAALLTAHTVQHQTRFSTGYASSWKPGVGRVKMAG